jgi:SanA protein
MQYSQFTFIIKWILITILIIVALTLPQWILRMRYAGQIYTSNNAPSKPTAVVFGAGLRRDGRPTKVLADRVSTAVALYRQGKVDHLLMSGSSRGLQYNEPAAMRSMALQMGVPEEDILMDPGGSRTLQTCLRARQMFGVEHALLVSQRFHLPRALVLCDTIGLNALGVAADVHPYHAQFFWRIREIPATLRALWDACIVKTRLARTSTAEVFDPQKGIDYGS